MNVLFNIKSNYRGNQSSFRIQPNSHKLGIIFPQSFIVLDQFFWLACPCEKEEAPDDVGTDVRSGPLRTWSSQSSYDSRLLEKHFADSNYLLFGSPTLCAAIIFCVGLRW